VFKLHDGDDVAFDSSGQVKISVQDSGVGMTKDQVSRLFGDGVQFNVNELQAGQGSGLGLFISKGIVEQHGGELTVDSEGLGKGTVFRMTMPLYDVPDAPKPEVDVESAYNVPDNSETKSESRSFRVLVVDDSMSNRKLLCRLLEIRGHECVQAENGRVAVDRVVESLATNLPFDTILMDYEMPVLSGPEATKEIRSKGCDSFIVGVSGNVLKEDVDYFKSCGANAVLPKPFQISSLEDLWTEYGYNSHLA